MAQEAIVRDAIAQGFDNIAAIAGAAYREYSHILPPDDWNTMQANLSNVAAIAKKQGNAIVADTTKSWLCQPYIILQAALTVSFSARVGIDLGCWQLLPQYWGQGIRATWVSARY